MAFSSPLLQRYIKSTYVEYQKRYRDNIRESDRVLIDLVRHVIKARGIAESGTRLLDIGCHTGNLLYHLKHQMPGLRLHGGDIFHEVIQDNRADADLAGIQFDVMDVRDLPRDVCYDIVIENAVCERLNDDEFEDAIERIAGAVTTDGFFLAFDWFHPFQQDLQILERSPEHPDGLDLYIRPFHKVSLLLEKNGFTDIAFTPFTLSIDLELSDDPSIVRSHTVQTADGQRLCFRGSLFQPWCHMRARKAT